MADAITVQQQFLIPEDPRHCKCQVLSSHAGSDGCRHVFPVACPRSSDCIYCESRRLNKLAKKIKHGLEYMPNAKFATFTLLPDQLPAGASIEQSVEVIRKLWPPLRKYVLSHKEKDPITKKWKWVTAPWFKVLEFGSKRGRLHVHVLIDDPDNLIPNVLSVKNESLTHYISRLTPEAAQFYQRLQQFGFGKYECEPVRSSAKSARYLSGYLSEAKMPSWINKSELKGVQLFSKSKDFKYPDETDRRYPYKDSDVGDPQRITETYPDAITTHIPPLSDYSIWYRPIIKRHDDMFQLQHTNDCQSFRNLVSTIPELQQRVQRLQRRLDPIELHFFQQYTIRFWSDQTIYSKLHIIHNMIQYYHVYSRISENLGVVQETVAPDPSATAIPSLMNEVENNVIKASFYAKQFAATNNEGAISTWPKNNDYGLEYDFTFSCDKPVLVDTVTVEATGPLDDVSAPTENTDNAITTNGYGHPILARQYYVDATATLDPATTIKVNGRTLVDTNFEVSADNNVAYIQPANFELMHLNPGQTLNFKTEVNFRAYTDVENPLFNNASTVSGSLVSTYGIVDTAVEAANIPYYPTSGVTNVDHDGGTTPEIAINTYANLTNGNSTQLEHFDFDIFKVNVDYISLSGSNAECALSLPDDPTTYPKKDTLLINLAATGDGLIKNFEATVDCNDRPTRIVGNELRASHAVGDSAVAASNLKIEAGGQSMSFKLTTDETLERASTTQPASLSFDSGTIKISGQVPQVSGVLLSLTYHTAAGNTCSIVTQ